MKLLEAYLVEGVYLGGSVRQSIIAGDKPSRAGAFTARDMQVSQPGVLVYLHGDDNPTLVPWACVKSAVVDAATLAPASGKGK